MAYATVSGVQGYIADITIGASSTPNTTTVETWIAQVEAEVNAALADCGYTVPVTGSEDIVLLRGIVEPYVAARVHSVATTDVEEPGHVRDWRQAYESRLKAMRSCEFRLYNQSRGGSSRRTATRYPSVLFDD